MRSARSSACPSCRAARRATCAGACSSCWWAGQCGQHGCHLGAAAAPQGVAQCLQLAAAEGGIHCRHQTKVLSLALLPQIDLTYSTWLLPISIGFQVGWAAHCLRPPWWRNCVLLGRASALLQPPSPARLQARPVAAMEVLTSRHSQVSDLEWTWACIVDLVAGAFFVVELVLGFHTRCAAAWARLMLYLCWHLSRPGPLCGACHRCNQAAA